jgi:hypothetical protein
MSFSFWKHSSSKTKRILFIIVFFLISLLVTIVGILTPISQQEANDISHELDQTRANANVQLIFGNNMMICLLMFVPVIGPFLGFLVLYNTGAVVAAETMTQSLGNPVLVFATLFLFPFTWLEFASYATALSESFFLIWRFIQRKGRKEIMNACILISLCAIMLLIAAAIEMLLISLVR